MEKIKPKLKREINTESLTTEALRHRAPHTTKSLFRTLINADLRRLGILLLIPLEKS